MYQYELMQQTLFFGFSLVGLDYRCCHEEYPHFQMYNYAIGLISGFPTVSATMDLLPELPKNSINGDYHE